MIYAKPDLRVVLKWMIARSGSVITDVITFHARSGWRDARSVQYQTRDMLVLRNSSLVQPREMPILVRNMLASDRHKRRGARHAIRGGNNDRMQPLSEN